MKLRITISLIFVSLSASLLGFAQTSSTSDAFNDVDRKHWAYSVSEQLRSHNVISGYPSTYFTSGMALTRYEFASAIENSLHRFHSGDLKLFDVTHVSIPEGITVSDVKLLKRLSDEFRSELTMITGSSDVPVQIIALLVQRLSSGNKDASVSRLPVTQLNRSFTLGSSPKSIGTPNSSVALNSMNIQEQLGLNKGFGTVSPLDGLKTIQLSQLKPNSEISLGLFNNLPFQKQSPSSLEGYPVDTPINLLHGVRASTSIGGIGLEAFSGSQSLLERQLSSPFSLGENLGGAGPSEAVNSNLDHVTSVSAGVGKADRGSHLRLTAIEASNSKSGSNNAISNNALVLGTDAHLRSNAFSLSADLRTSSNLQGKLDPSSGTSEYSNAFDGALGLNVGSLTLAAGYRYVDPLFYSPGYWGRIGSWINPTNIQGPTFRANLDLLPGFGINLGGDFLSGIKDRSSLGGLTNGDDINRVLVGLRWDVGKNIRTTIDWEGVYYKLDPSRSASSLSSSGPHPIERYITLGTGYSLSNSTLFKLNYTVGDLGTRSGNSVSGQSSLFNSFSGQVSIKF